MINIARGNEAKAWATQKIIECFGQNQVVLSDKKIYINTKENGEPIQVCVALTCPKTMVGEEAAAAVATAKTGVDFGAFGAPTTPEPPKVAEITPSERQTVQELMKSLGL